MERKIKEDDKGEEEQKKKGNVRGEEEKGREVREKGR